MLIRVIGFNTNEKRLNYIKEFKNTIECKNLIAKMYSSDKVKFRDILINELVFEDVSEYVCEKIQETVSEDDFTKWYIEDNWVSITRLTNKYKVFG